MHSVITKLLLVAIVVLQALPVTRAAVIGIDLGSQFVKVGIIRPGSAIEIVEDETSKRKLPLVIGFDEDQRRFGNGASSLLSRKPMRVVSGFRDWSSQVFAIDEDTITSHELVAMIMEHIGKLARDANNGMEVKNVVITVPAFYSQQKRMALIEAAEIAGLKVLSLIGENTAAALQYGIERTLEVNQSTTVVIYNMGAKETTVSVARYSAYKKNITRKTEKTIGQVEILGIGYDESLGGWAFEERILDLMAARFQDQMTSTGIDIEVREDPRIMARLRQAAAKSKEVLSANTERPVYVERLYDDYDFQTTITRDEFYDLSQDLFGRVSKPVFQAFDQAGVSIDDTDVFLLIGGGMRIPQIQTTLKEDIGIKQFNLNLNSDESPAWGATLRAANMSTTFRVRDFGVSDLLPYPIGIRISHLNGDSDWTKRASISSRNTPVPSMKRTVKFQNTEDLLVKMYYDVDSQSLPLPEGTEKEIVNFEVKGVAKFLEGLDETADLETLRTVLYFKVLESGVTDLVSAKVTVDVTIPVEKPKIVPSTAKEDSVDLSDEEDIEDDSGESENIEANKEDSMEEYVENVENSDSSINEAVETETTYTTRVKEGNLRIVRVRATETSVTPVTSEDRKKSRELLSRYRESDLSAIKLAEAMNSYEGYIYSTRSRLNYEEDIQSVVVEEERSSLLNTLEDAEDWLYDNDEPETAEKYERELGKLKELADPIFFRAKELKERPKAIKDSLTLFSIIRKSLEVKLSYLEQEDKERMESKIETVETWLGEKQEEQKEKKPHEDAAFTSYELYEKLEPITRYFKVLKRRPKPKPKVETTVNNTEGNATEKNSTVPLNDDVDPNVPPSQEENPESDSVPSNGEDKTPVEDDYEIHDEL